MLKFYVTVFFTYQTRFSIYSKKVQACTTIFKVDANASSMNGRAGGAKRPAKRPTVTVPVDNTVIVSQEAQGGWLPSGSSLRLPQTPSNRRNGTLLQYWNGGGGARPFSWHPRSCCPAWRPAALSQLDRQFWKIGYYCRV